MKYIGFIKEHNKIKEAVAFEEAIKLPYDNKETNKIIEYLNKGILLLAWMGYFTDIKTNELIAPDSYLTDGVWIWPSYLPYYLNKFPSFHLDDDFINYLKERNYEFNLKKDFITSKKIFENDLSIKLNEEI